MKRIAPGVMDDSARFKAELVRDELRKRGFLKKNVVRYCYRPFDVRWLYWGRRQIFSTGIVRIIFCKSLTAILIWPPNKSHGVNGRSHNFFAVSDALI